MDPLQIFICRVLPAILRNDLLDEMKMIGIDITIAFIDTSDELDDFYIDIGFNSAVSGNSLFSYDELKKFLNDDIKTILGINRDYGRAKESLINEMKAYNDIFSSKETF